MRENENLKYEELEKRLKDAEELAISQRTECLQQILYDLNNQITRLVKALRKGDPPEAFEELAIAENEAAT